MPDFKLSRPLIELAHAMHAIHEAFAKGYELPPIDDEIRRRFFDDGRQDGGALSDDDFNHVASTFPTKPPQPDDTPPTVTSVAPPRHDDLEDAADPKQFEDTAEEPSDTPPQNPSDAGDAG